MGKATPGVVCVPPTSGIRDGASMLRTTGTRRRLAALLVPSFLVVHLVCVCFPAAAAPMPAGAHHDQHDCCPTDGQKTPRPEHDASCGHCGVAQLGVAPAAVTVAPTPLVTPVALPTSHPEVGSSFVRRHVDASRGSPPTPSLLHRTCVLIV
jgi:hypothetical protein